MNPVIRRMLKRYPRDTLDQNVNALREILQQLALLGLWRCKFFEHAAFYGGTALRILHGLDRYSEDLDFSLLAPDPGFSLDRYGTALEQEMAAFGFDVSFESKKKTRKTAIESAFLKTSTIEQMLVIETDRALLGGLAPRQKLKVRLEIDVDPPGGFVTESVPILQPVPFAVRAFTLPDLFAGKMHAVLCRRWRNRVKGRDWYDLVWYLGNHPKLRIRHLEERMRQSGDYTDREPLSQARLNEVLRNTLKNLEVAKARAEVMPFLPDARTTEVWSRDFFSQIVGRIEPI